MKKSQSRKRRARQKPTDGVTPERARRLIDDLTRERELMDAAGFLWGNQPYVVWRVEKQPQVKADAALRKYPAKFTLQRSESPSANPETAGLIKRNTDDHPHEELWRAMYIEKLTSDFARRWQKAIRSGPLMDRLYNRSTRAPARIIAALPIRAVFPRAVDFRSP